MNPITQLQQSQNIATQFTYLLFFIYLCVSWIFFFFLFLFKTRSPYVAQADSEFIRVNEDSLKFAILLLWSPKYWDCRCIPPHPPECIF